MSISSFTTVTMLDSRPSQITISMPKTTDILNRIITFKDLYGSSSNSTITLVTRSGDTFEDGTFSTILSNAYQTVNLYAGQPGKWLNIDGGSGGSSAGLSIVSNNLTTVSNSVETNAGYFGSLSNQVNTNYGYLTTVSNSTDTNTASILTISNRLNAVSTIAINASTNVATVSNNLTTVSNNLTTVSNTVAAGRFPYVSANTISTSLLMAGYVSSPQGYISSLVVDALSFSLSNSFISMGDIITTSVSTIQTFTSTLTTNNLKVGTLSSLNYIAFAGLQKGYNQTVVAEQATASGIQELLIFKGSTNTDRIRMQTTGPIVFEPGVSARVFSATPSNATPAMIINTSSNVGIGVAAPTVALDVAGAGRFTAVSTQTISTNIVNAGYLVGQSTNTATTSVSPLAVVNGGANTTYISQIEFQFNGGGFKHFMGSRHNDSWFNNSCNAIDFWLFSGSGQNASTTPGTCNVNTMSVTAAGVGICNLTPSVALDVAGAGRFTAISTTTISTASITAGGTINITSPLTNCTGEIYASGGAIRIVGSSTTFDLWNYCSLTQVSGNLTINSYSNVTTTASSNININATSTIYISSGGNAINLSGNIDINNKNISNVNITQTVALSTQTISTNSINTSSINGSDLDLTATSINLHTSSIQQYLNFVPVAQPVIQFGSWSAGAANTDSTGGPYTVPITDYANTNYCIYITGKYTTFTVAYSAVPVDGSNFNVYFVNGDTNGSNIFYWQTMGYYGANAGPAQGSGGGGGGGGTGH